MKATTSMEIFGRDGAGMESNEGGEGGEEGVPRSVRIFILKKRRRGSGTAVTAGTAAAEGARGGTLQLHSAWGAF